MLLAVLAAGMAVPHPGAGTVRAWADSLGPWFPVAFFLVHVVITVLPIPRTFFTVLAGFLFGPALGIGICMAASTVAAAIAFGGVRRLDRRHRSAVLDRIRGHRAYLAIAARLRERGWLAVGSLRLIAVMPFSVLNYAAALSPVRLTPYLAATVIGLAPGTCAVVILGDALTGAASPWQLLISAGLVLIGIAGLLLDARAPARAP